MKSENFKTLTPSYDSFNDDENELFKSDNSNLLDIHKINFDKTHLNMSHFTLCECFGSRVLGLSGYSLMAYRLLGSFAINNYARFNGLYCCFSFYWLARSLNCAVSTAKRIIKSLCDKQILLKIGRGFNGRNAYRLLKHYEFDYLGALMVYYETLDKKSSKKINLKNKDNNNINNFGLPSWVSIGNYQRFLDKFTFNDNELYKIAKIKWVNS